MTVERGKLERWGNVYSETNLAQYASGYTSMAKQKLATNTTWNRVCTAFFFRNENRLACINRIFNLF